uniref:Uncharacterized protein n=1 Tax=Cacopsylla melanoneura TaxID=428564 RepID=A0A8D8QY08_9HEMI
MMRTSASLVSISLTQIMLIVNAQYIPEQTTTINVVGVVERLNEVFGLGMNISALIAKYKPQANTQHQGFQSHNENVNSFVPNYPGGFVPQNAAPNPQNNGLISMNAIPNNMPNQFAPSPQNNGFVSMNGIPNNILE